MEARLLNFTRRFRPELTDLPIEQRLTGIGDVLGVLYSVPIAIVGILWLSLSTDLSRLQENTLQFLIFGALYVIFNRMVFFLVVELGPNRFASADGSLSGIVLWSAMLVIGPSFIWIPVLLFIYNLIIEMRRAPTTAMRWNHLRNFGLQLAMNTTGLLISLTLYQILGGKIPFTGFTSPAVLPILSAMLLQLLLMVLLWTGYFGSIYWAMRVIGETVHLREMLLFFLIALGLNFAPHPFAILAAGLLVENGWATFLFFMLGMLLVATLARRLSKAAEGTRRQSRLLEKLEQLGRAIINAPPEDEDLPSILAEHIPNMFPGGNLVIWTFPDQMMFKQPVSWEPNLDPIWPWLLRQSDVQAYLPSDPLPWMETHNSHHPILVASIQEMETGQVFGGIYLELHTLAQAWDHPALIALAPAMQSLSAQIASALHQAVVYQRTLAYQRMTEELRWAGSIQASLLPTAFPEIPGWQLAVALNPAGETSGDFFDIIPLEDGKIGIVVADVLDKGVGPALYMAISRTLIRTYAIELDAQPDTVFFATNERILTDTTSNLFVTAFYGVLDPQTGEMTYCNAGHNPPYLFRSSNADEMEALRQNAIPIGIDQDAAWGSEMIQLHPGDALVLYTDGIPEAQNSAGEFFGPEPIIEVVKENFGKTAGDLQSSILDAVHHFVGDAPQQDDITLMILVRDK